ncbi:hypothetical protein HYH02_010732 [Chlamydomonas schloesseri]|uniref:BTB domain-containing protein n=1 Tax=Chlamydomonas schloesseri TaxID=2026947 RepID=A0A835T4Z5_9CHLO|nr:hypothetical protein HYH02_010732 [Chlamydomonas schloesseri]|eukprot:KAG2438939.1 hypothetical protein HYH02_010732 [Chlamydomonas schloesseri]
MLGQWGDKAGVDESPAAATAAPVPVAVEGGGWKTQLLQGTGNSWTALAYDTDRDLLYGATSTRVYSLNLGPDTDSASGGDSDGSSDTGGTGGDAGSSSSSTAKAQQQQQQPQQQQQQPQARLTAEPGSFSDITALLVPPLDATTPPAAPGLLVADGARLCRLNPWSGAVMVLSDFSTSTSSNSSMLMTAPTFGALFPPPIRRLTSLAYLPDGNGVAALGMHGASAVGNSMLAVFTGPALGAASGRTAAGSADGRSMPPLDVLLRMPHEAAAGGGGGGGGGSGGAGAIRKRQRDSDGATALGGAGAGGAAAGPGMVVVRVSGAAAAAGTTSAGTNSTGTTTTTTACFLAHRAVLEAHSDFFKQLLASELREAADQAVELREADPAVFGALLTYMYTGALGPLGVRQFKAAAELADRLLLPGAVLQLQPRLLAAVSPHSAVADLHWAWRHNLREVAGPIGELVARHAARVAALTPLAEVAALAAAQPELMASLFMAVSRGGETGGEGLGAGAGAAVVICGLGKRYRQAVEALFRAKVLQVGRVVFATGTLALGVHMPARCVVMAGDSPHLDALNFCQMAGRSGRRGLDTEGTAVFAGVSAERIHELRRSPMPRLQGHLLLRPTTLLRLLMLHDKVAESAPAAAARSGGGAAGARERLRAPVVLAAKLLLEPFLAYAPAVGGEAVGPTALAASHNGDRPQQQQQQQAVAAHATAGPAGRVGCIAGQGAGGGGAADVAAAMPAAAVSRAALQRQLAVGLQALRLGALLHPATGRPSGLAGLAAHLF